MGGSELKEYGFSTNFEGLGATAVGQRMDAMKAAGATWVRFDLGWNTVQPLSARSYNWSQSDIVARAAVARGLRPLVIIDFTPVWARSASCKSTKFCAPASDATMAGFAAAAASRYAPLGVHDWEIWNEPNLAGRWQPRADPVEYTNLLKAVYPAIKQADDEATVIAGATAPAATGNGDFRPDDFVSAMYEARAHGSFDALSTHPYTYPLTPSGSSTADAWGQMTAIHRMMVANGDGQKLLWVTEYGAPTNGPSDSSVPHVTEAVQAQMVDEAIRIFRGYSWGGCRSFGTTTKTSAPTRPASKTSSAWSVPTAVLSPVTPYFSKTPPSTGSLRFALPAVPGYYLVHSRGSGWLGGAQIIVRGGTYHKCCCASCCRCTAGRSIWPACQYR